MHYSLHAPSETSSNAPQLLTIQPHSTGMPHSSSSTHQNSLYISPVVWCSIHIHRLRDIDMSTAYRQYEHTSPIIREDCPYPWHTESVTDSSCAHDRYPLHHWSQFNCTPHFSSSSCTIASCAIDAPIPAVLGYPTA